LNSGFCSYKQVLYCLSHTSSPFCYDYFGDVVSQTICSGCPRATILPITVSQVARVTGMSNQCSASVPFLCFPITEHTCCHLKYSDEDQHICFNILAGCECMG
jgi:hypothetical protein